MQKDRHISRLEKRKVREGEQRLAEKPRVRAMDAQRSSGVQKKKRRLTL